MEASSTLIWLLPILELIANHPEVDFGSPGELVHFVEKFYHQGYEIYYWSQF